MNALHDTAEKRERAFLVGVETDRMKRSETESLLRELGGLAGSLGLEKAGAMTVKLREKTPALLVGTGKADEIVQAARASEADSIIFDHIVSPMQQRNWETLSGLKVFDRAELIIRIFASRAMTREASLQVELAQLEYSLPRLAHSYEYLSRQRGGRYGTKGSGEQKLELDRRSIERRIHDIKDELKEVRRSRDVQHRRREKVSMPRAALVGYTNAGKSSLLNALANASVGVEDKLFATLDPTTRRIRLASGGTVLLTDTVGFVRNLPHGLVEAFKATLEEAADADLLVHVADASDPDMETHIATTERVLAEIGAGEVPRLLVLNKSDLASPAGAAEGREIAHPEGIPVSAKTGENLDRLVAAMGGSLTETMREVRLRIPPSEYALVALLHREASMIEELHDDEGTIVTCRVPARLESRVRPYLDGSGPDVREE